jgi:hypothetical protein
MGAKGRKAAMIIVPLVLLGGLGVAMAAGGKRPPKTGAEPDGDDDDDDGPDGIDLDVLPDQAPPSPSNVSLPGPPVPVSTEEIDSSDGDDDDGDDGDDQSPGMPQVNPDERETDVRLPDVLQIPTTLPTEPHMSIPPAAQVPIPQVPIPNVQVPAAIPVSLPPAVQVPQAIQVDQLTGRLIDELRTAERVANWKRVYPIVQQWQAQHGRTVDGKFGPKDALYLATIAPDVPVVRYWPLSDGPNPQAALASFRNAVLAIAAQRPPEWAAGLQRAMQIEKGQSFGPPVGDGGRLPVSV